MHFNLHGCPYVGSQSSLSYVFECQRHKDSAPVQEPAGQKVYSAGVLNRFSCLQQPLTRNLNIVIFITSYMDAIGLF